MSWLNRLEFYETLRSATERKARQELPGEGDRESFMDALRQFKQREELERYGSYQERKMNLEELLFSLTALAQVCLQEAYLFESTAMRLTYGLPNSHYHMVAMGKFGGCEMTVKSDIDLIFIFAEPAETTGPKKITNQEYFAKLTQRMISNLSTMTCSGRAYEVDARLRPSGRAGILVTSWDSFAAYHMKQARTWEKQALLKSRPIEPDPQVYWDVHEKLVAQIWNRDFGSETGKEIHQVRLKMERELAREDSKYYNIKVGLGGITDIEFIVQYLQLKYGADRKSIQAPHTLTVLRALVAEELLDGAIGEMLEKAYLFYRQIETCMRHFQQRAINLLPRGEGEELELLADAMGQKMSSLVKGYETFRTQVRQIYEKVLHLR